MNCGVVLVYVTHKLQVDETNQQSYIKFKHIQHNITPLNLALNFSYVVNVVFFLLGNSLASSQLFFTFTQLITIQLPECSEMLAHKIQMPGNHQKERIQYYTFNFTVFFFCVGCDKELNGLME